MKSSKLLNAIQLIEDIGVDISSLTRTKIDNGTRTRSKSANVCPYDSNRRWLIECDFCPYYPYVPLNDIRTVDSICFDMKEKLSSLNKTIDDLTNAFQTLLEFYDELD